MKKIILALCCMSASVTFAQNVKSEDLEYSKIVMPTILNLEKPVDLNILRVSNSDFINKSGLLNLNFGKTNFISYNTSNPKYIAVLEYTYIDPYLYHQKKTLNEIIIKSNIEAKLHLIEAGKGIFDTEIIKLQNQQNENTIGRGYYEVSSTINKSLISDAEAAPFLKDGKFPNPEKVMEVETEQMLRISEIANRKIKEKITSSEEDAKIEFNYLKEDKNFNSSDFDAIYNTVKQSLKPINASQLRSAVKGLKTEFDNYQTSTDKKIIKYKEALLEDIITLSYLTDDYGDATTYEELMNGVNPKNRQMSWFMRTKKKYENSNNRLGQPLAYSPIPDHLLSTSSTTKVLTQSTDEQDYKIEKLNKNEFSNYIQSTIQLNNLSYQLKAIQKGGLLPQHENDIFNKIIWTIINYNNNFNTLRGSEKSIIKDFANFSGAFAKEMKEKKIYNFNDSKDVMLMKIRAYVSKNMKIEDFTKYISSIDQAILERTNEKKEYTREAYRSAIHMNSIVQMRDLLADDLFMENERKSFEDNLNKILEEQVNILLGKDASYHEFKKSIRVFESIKNKRQLSKEEYENYEILLNNVIAKFVYNF
ncbi:hypothetical protein LZQ00_18345 [Sphingobacterium sp. SRCM116780]|uniref:hypothetical protein n=1 Tax=Sphingobacterium sp. SRCM116780 TaxID=2907623 RepID=UPI001F46973C|nr:hypothetical protein [Sphingobacterium sp. SRCM116780]UIR56209.1 hypothetical protein LZQ00_18345 [Sphingobacterium sp. SRCM116780]